MRYLGLVAELSTCRRDLDHLYQLCITEMINRAARKLLANELHQGVMIMLCVYSVMLLLCCYCSITVQRSHCYRLLPQLLSGELCITSVQHEVWPAWVVQLAGRSVVWAYRMALQKWTLPKYLILAYDALGVCACDFYYHTTFY